MKRLREAVARLLQIDEPPQRMALAFGVGVWIGFSPFFGLHTWMALAVAVMFGLNRVALLVGAWLNAWTAVPALVIGTTLGCWMLGVSSAGLVHVKWRGSGVMFLRTLLRDLGPYLWPFLVGNAVLGIPLGLAAYLGLLYALKLKARRREPPAPLP